MPGNPRDIPQAMQSAVGQLQAGAFDEAAKICRDILAVDAGFGPACHVLGVALHRQGQSDEAVRHIRHAIEIDPGVVDAYNNLGNVLKDMGRVDEAIANFKKAIELRPDFAMAHYNLGAAYRQHERPKLAVESYQRALELQPGNAAIHNNLGNVWRDLGRFKEAIASFAKAIELDPNGLESLFNFAEANRRQGLHAPALDAYVRALRIDRGHAPSVTGLGYILTGRAFSAIVEAPPPDARELLLTCLSRDDVEHQDFFPSALELLLDTATTAAIREFIGSDGQRRDQQGSGDLDSVSSLLNDELFLILLRKTTIADQLLERFLTIARSTVLHAVTSGATKKIEPIAEFVTALACQCFVTEYLFQRTADEDRMIQRLIEDLEDAAEHDGPCDPVNVSALACYQSLGGSGLSDSLARRLGEDGPAELYDNQIMQVRRDESIAAALDSLSDIDEGVSRDVRLQYEESPYPPWTGTYRVKAAPFERHLGTDILPCQPPPGVNLDRPDVLIAGCGTGKHAIESAMRYVDCRMLAVDLSRRSLAYGKRKAAEFDMDNIEFLQADILDLPKLDRQFDVIESVGVLHHMADPMAGLAALMRVLRPGGFLKLGLYSELGRKSVVAAREFVAQGGFGSDPDGIREARQAIFALPVDHPAKDVTEPLDFYSLSAVRDYLFHVQEHRLSLPEISSALDAHGLSFLGFVLDVASLRSFGAMFPEEGSFLSLEKWHQFEEVNPNTFSAMYQFWARKTGQS